jgi:hypothetical protein
LEALVDVNRAGEKSWISGIEQQRATKRIDASAQPKPTKMPTGDPALEPATFTRFLWPFAYLPVVDERPPSLRRRARRGAGGAAPNSKRDELCTLVWNESTPAVTAGVLEVERVRYFTPEIAQLFHRRAKRFTLKISEKVALTFESELLQKPATIALKPPELLLFEWAGPDEDPSPSPDLQRVGLLIVEAYFPSVCCGAVPMSYTQLLEFNHLYRHALSPFELFATKYGVSDTLKSDPLRRGFSDADGANWSAVDGYLMPWRELLDVPLEMNVGGAAMRLRLMPGEWMDRAKLIADPPLTQLNAASALTDLDCRASANQPMIWPDERAFVQTCAVLDHSPKVLCQAEERLVHSGAWVKLLNVDGFGMPPSGLFASEFEKHWAEERTYLRWEHFNALYGFTTHSAAMLSQAINEPPTWQHFRTLYFDQTCLLLYVRCVLFRFSGEITRLASQMRDAASRSARSASRDRLIELDQSFAQFVQLYQFPLLSNQQQGVEMYALQREHMDIKELFTEIQDEIRHMHQSYDLHHDRQFRQIAVVIAAIALLALVDPLKDLWKAYAKGGGDLLYWTNALMVVFFIGCILLSLYALRRR